MSIIVRNLFPNVTEVQVREIFSPFGEIKRLRLDVDHNHTMIAIVGYQTGGSALQAMSKVDGTYILGSVVSVCIHIDGMSPRKNPSTYNYPKAKPPVFSTPPANYTMGLQNVAGVQHLQVVPMQQIQQFPTVYYSAPTAINMAVSAPMIAPLINNDSSSNAKNLSNVESCSHNHGQDFGGLKQHLDGGASNIDPRMAPYKN